MKIDVSHAKDAVAGPFNVASYLVGKETVRDVASRIALVDASESINYDELRNRVISAAAGWKSIGLRPAHRVMIHAADTVRAVIAFLSTIWCGAVPAFVSTLYSSDEVLCLSKEMEAEFLVVDEAKFLEMRSMKRDGFDGEKIVVLDGPAISSVIHESACLSWMRLVARGEGNYIPVENTDEDSVAFWIYTSGSTGKPKAVMHRHGSVRTIISGYGSEILELSRDDRCLSASKLGFAYGLGNSCFFPLAAGASSILLSENSTARSLQDAIVKYEPTVFFGMPALFSAMLKNLSPRDLFDKIRLVVSAGEALPSELQRKFRDRFGVEIVNGLGCTEMLHIFVSNRPGFATTDHVGHVVPGYQVRIVRDDGSPTCLGQPGRLQVRGPSATVGYWRRIHEERYLFDGDWLNTGDIAIGGDSAGYRLIGRVNDMMKVGALWVSPNEIESVVLQHRFVQAAGVTSKPDSFGTGYLVACVVLAAEEDKRKLIVDDLFKFCREKLPPGKRPREILAVDALPINHAGKLQRAKLRELLIEESKGE
ncbi:benzoate-CoA ligase family protein [Burkholderia sp. ABCPW 11]|uniref:benzoate-CoA ligase family protein n=1 Tax=Burkholderia sp. ABCPW 11 TaxID=1637859 RepID=UPI000A73459D|nr:benzoate-CoA ligase family protein [Burkholderia sp. ABCPW 11]